MKVLLNHHLPFLLAHGGTQIQIEQTNAALARIGVEVEPLRWWDENQTGDILHHFGRIPSWLVRFAQQKGMKVLLADLMTQQGSRSRGQLLMQKYIAGLMRSALPAKLITAFQWESYRLVDACLALTGWEAKLMMELYGAAEHKVHVVPNGVEEVFFTVGPHQRGQWLVCTAAITERKRVLELASAALEASIPVWIIGQPYSGSSTYYERFLQLARANPTIIRYEGGINDRPRLASIYQEARGFVLLSTMESLSLSALEAAAAGCPLLLSDLPWAKTVFGQNARYCSITASAQSAGAVLRKFYEAAPTMHLPPRPATWLEVGQQLKQLYDRLLTRGTNSSKVASLA
jgi:glycosyltransferase involved in cell wall biosynthesis